MNYAIRYLTEYRYESEVTDNLNALRVKPAATATQRVDEFQVRLDPGARLHRHSDYFGTEVVEFGVAGPHAHLTIDVRARVATKPPPEPQQAPWSAIAEEGYREVAAEFLLRTDAAYGLGLDAVTDATRADTPLATLMAVSERIPDRFEYRAGVTYVGSTVQELLEGGAGVCQDFVHLGLAVLRRQGIGARYVSGYLFASRSDGGEESVEVDTHAWLEALVPGFDGGAPTWVGIDPTNRGLSGERHVKIGHGRNYQDVPPIKGVYRGVSRATLEASVRMTRTHREDPAAGARAS